MTKRILLITLLLLVQWKVQGQDYSIKDLNLEGNIDKWFNSHFDSANIKPMIGALPIVAPPRRTTNVFFIENSRNWNESSMMYDNQLYGSVRMKYDLEKQIIYILNPQTLQPVTLNQDLVNWIKSPIGTFKPRNNAKGYYLIIFEGNQFTLTKESIKNLVIDSGDFEYKRTDAIYFIKGDQKKSIRNAKSLMKQFPSHKKEIKKFMRQKESREIKRSGKENFLIHVAEFCDNLDTL